MTLFTKNPLERLMMQRPYPGKEGTPRTPAPEGHFCCGCSRYGTVCLRPCYRDTDLRVAGEPLPTIKSMDTDGIVIYAGSFSKILSPGLRVAYCVGPKPVLAKMTVGKQAEDVHTAMLNQMIVYQWFRQYDVDAHIEKIRGIYRKKLELMCNCIDSDLGDFVEYVRPQGGLFIWCKLPGDVDMLDFCKRAIAKQVAVVPGNAFMMDDKAVSHHIRLNFSTPSDQAIVAGVHRLGEVAAGLRSK